MIYRIRQFFWNFWWIKIRRFRPIKESTFGSLEKVKETNNCEHRWKPIKGIIFEYILVNAQCEKCKTFRK